jgi:hypothetical protein
MCMQKCSNSLSSSFPLGRHRPPTSCASCWTSCPRRRQSSACPPPRRCSGPPPAVRSWRAGRRGFSARGRICVRGGEERELFALLLLEEYLCAWRRGAGMKKMRTSEQPLAWPSRMSWERWQYFKEKVAYISCLYRTLKNS